MKPAPEGPAPKCVSPNNPGGLPRSPQHTDPQVDGWSDEFAALDPVLAGLRALFRALTQQQQDEAAAAAGATAAASGAAKPAATSWAAAVRGATAAPGSGGTMQRTPVDPTPLREALALLPGQQFGLGERALCMGLDGSLG